MDIKQFSQSHKVTTALLALVLFVAICAAFTAGEYVGFHKASFAFQNGNNFYKTFGPRGGPMMSPGNFSDDHGTAGKVISIALPNITIADKDATEKTIVVTDHTIIRKFRDTINAQNIAVGDYIVAIGDPNAQSQVTAAFIRILPPQ